MYLMVQSCLHVVINFPQPPKPNQNMLHFTPFHQPLQNSTEFRGNLEIPQKQANSGAQPKIPHTAENCGPYSYGLPKSRNHAETHIEADCAHTELVLM